MKRRLSPEMEKKREGIGNFKQRIKCHPGSIVNFLGLLSNGQSDSCGDSGNRGAIRLTLHLILPVEHV